MDHQMSWNISRLRTAVCVCVYIIVRVHVHRTYVCQDKCVHTYVYFTLACVF